MCAFEHMSRRQYLSINKSFNIASISQIQLLTAARKVSSIERQIQAQIRNVNDQHYKRPYLSTNVVAIARENVISQQGSIANAESLKHSQDANFVIKSLPVEKSNLRAMRFMAKPIKKSPAILMIFLILTGLFSLMAKGTAMPMMKRNAGKMKSAAVSPCQSGWQIQQGGLFTGPKSSTIIMPTMVSPRQMSSDFMRTFDFGCCGCPITSFTSTDWVRVCLSVRRLSVIWLARLTSSAIFEIFNQISSIARIMVILIKKSFCLVLLLFIIGSQQLIHMLALLFNRGKQKSRGLSQLFIRIF